MQNEIIDSIAVQVAQTLFIEKVTNASFVNIVALGLWRTIKSSISKALSGNLLCGITDNVFIKINFMNV
jgi:hypothetical protein